MRQLVLFTFLLLVSLSAHAHPAGSAIGFYAGMAHPFGGLDHLMAMLAVGLWATQQGGRAAWLLPFTFIACMAGGGALGVTGIAAPLAETGILMSLLVLGALVATAIRLPVLLSVTIVGLFALCHGHAHGAELPADVSALGYVAGFLGVTALLHLFGWVIAKAALESGRGDWLRLAGVAVVLTGLAA